MLILNSSQETLARLGLSDEDYAERAAELLYAEAAERGTQPGTAQAGRE